MVLFVSLVAFGAPPLPPTVAPPSNPGSASSPYAPPDSWLTGEAGSLDIEALATVLRGFDITADSSGVAAVTVANAGAVLRQLAADARFRVTEEDGAIVAYRRVRDGNEWTTGYHGYQSTKKGAWRALIRMSPYLRSPWNDSKLVSRTDALAGKISCIAFHPTSHGDLDTVALQWNGPVASLEVLDAGDDELPGVQEALGYLPSYLSGIASDADEINTKGYTAVFNAPRDPRRGEPTVDVTSPQPKELEVRARIHTSQKGVTWVRLLDDTLRPWEVDAVASGTREMVGWSSDPKEVFYLQGRFFVPSGPKFSGTAEIWFQADGKAPERLGAFNVNVPKH
jgi:hypothetical protein